MVQWTLLCVFCVLCPITPLVLEKPSVLRNLHKHISPSPFISVIAVFLLSFCLTHSQLSSMLYICVLDVNLVKQLLVRCDLGQHPSGENPVTLSNVHSYSTNFSFFILKCV